MLSHDPKMEMDFMAEIVFLYYYLKMEGYVGSHS